MDAQQWRERRLLNSLAEVEDALKRGQSHTPHVNLEDVPYVKTYLEQKGFKVEILSDYLIKWKFEGDSQKLNKIIQDRLYPAK